MSDLIEDAKNVETMTDTIQEMININIVRYDVKGNIKWHSKIIEKEWMKMINWRID